MLNPKIILSILLANTIALSVHAQTKKEKRQTKKEQARMQSELDFEMAMAAMEGQTFVFQADYVMLDKSNGYVASHTNTFVAVNGDNIVIQVEVPAGYTSVTSPWDYDFREVENSTITGTIDTIKLKRNKRGDFIYEIYYNVRNSPHQLPIYLVKGGNNANCRIEGKAKMNGRILLPSQSAHFNGHYIPDLPVGFE